MLSHSVMFNSLQPYGLSLTRLLCPWDGPGKNTGVGCHFPLPRDFPYPGIEPTSSEPSALAGGFFTTEPPGEPSLIVHMYKINKQQGNTASIGVRAPYKRLRFNVFYAL